MIDAYRCPNMVQLTRLLAARQHVDLRLTLEALSREPLLGAIGEALSVINVHDPQGFFEHAGYRSLDQLLRNVRHVPQ